MSATSQSSDPVVTVIDLLDGTTEGNWPNGTKPDPIEEQWESDFRTKSNRNDPAAYVWSPEAGTRTQLGAEYTSVVQGETIGVDVWARNATDADEIAADVISILEDYANDFQANTNWVTVRPVSVDDRRAETLAMRADQHIISVRVELMTVSTTGT